jgi:hypothetical protein
VKIASEVPFDMFVCNVPKLDKLPKPANFIRHHADITKSPLLAYYSLFGTAW